MDIRVSWYKNRGFSWTLIDTQFDPAMHSERLIWGDSCYKGPFWVHSWMVLMNIQKYICRKQANLNLHPRPEKCCKMSSSGEFRSLQCLQNSVIHDKGWPEICFIPVGLAWWNRQISIIHTQSKAIHPQFWVKKSSILHPSTLNLLFPTSILHLQLFFHHALWKILENLT